MIEIDVRRMAVALCAAIAALAVLSLLGLIFEFGLGRDHVKGFVPMFRLSMERNVPTVFSTLLLFSLSGVLFLVGEGARARKDSRAAQWRALAVIALLLAFDEGGHIHELLDEETAWIEWLIEPSGAFAWPWVIAYACLTVAVSLFFLPLFLSLPTRYRVIFGTAAALFVSGALGLDMLEAQAFDAGRSPLLIEALCSLEEVMEMSAVAIALCGLAAYAEETFGWRRVAFLGDQPA